MSRQPYWHAFGSLNDALPVVEDLPDFRGAPVSVGPDLALALGLGTPRFAAHRIPDSTGCLWEARTFTAHVLRRWKLQLVSDDIVQVVSELVANAVRHGRDSGTQGGEGVWLGLVQQAHHLLCVVQDPNTMIPRMQRPSKWSEHGLGLPIVAALSDEWGWTKPEEDGKRVWARMPLAPPADRTP